MSASDLEKLAPRERPDRGPLRLLVAGELVRRKGIHLVIGALAIVGETCDWRLEIVGDARERQWMERRVAALNLSHRVRFRGAVPRHAFFDALREADVLVHASLRDSASFTCVEVMTAGLIVVCLDHGGPGVQVPDGGGMKIAINEPARVARGIAEAIRGLCADPIARRNMAAAARSHAVAELSWSARHRRFMATLKQAGLYDDSGDSRLSSPA